MCRFAVLFRRSDSAAGGRGRECRSDRYPVGKVVVRRAGVRRARDSDGVATARKVGPDFVVIPGAAAQPDMRNTLRVSHIEHGAAAREGVAHRVRASRRAKRVAVAPRNKDLVGRSVLYPGEIDDRATLRLGRQNGRRRRIGRAHPKRHRRARRAEIVENGARARPVPPLGIRDFGIGKYIGVIGRRILRVIRIAGISIIVEQLKPAQSIGLHQAALVVTLRRARLLVVAAGLVHVPDADARSGQIRVHTALLAVFHDEIFRGRRVSVFRIEVKLVHPRAHRGDQRRGARERGDGRRPARLILQIGANLGRRLQMAP